MDAGAQLRNVQYAMGHDSIKTTERYLAWTVGDLRAAMGGHTYGPTSTLAGGVVDHSA